MRSPFCYLSLDRVLALRARYDLEVNLRVVYPIAIRNPQFFKTAPQHYRSYHLRDSNRLAEYLGIPYRRPIPDPITQNIDTSEITHCAGHIGVIWSKRFFVDRQALFVKRLGFRIANHFPVETCQVVEICGIARMIFAKLLLTYF